MSTPQGDLARAVERCARCGRPVQAGQVFVGAAGLTDDQVCGACGQPLDLDAPLPEPATSTVYEEKVVPCAPADLDRLARAEAVDGWALHETTVDARAADRVVAHFRRPVPVRPPATAPSLPAAESPARRGGASSSPTTMPAKSGKSSAPRSREARPAAVEAPRPAPQPLATPGSDLRGLALVVLWLLGLIFLTSELGTFGFIMGMFVLPGVLRNILGLARDGRDRRR